ncbi:MAG: hypothetical protein ACYTFW_05280 [Planctomycetota bacterium]|jgi:hypothetical protein
MKQLIISTIISVLVMFFAGCAEPCFYQAGKSIEQCERDLLECFYSAHPTRLCMEARGYQYLDAKKIPQDSKPKKVVLLFEENMVSGSRKAMSEEYWVADGLGAASGNRQVVSEQKPQKSDLSAPSRELIGYRARKDESGKYVFIPVYEDEQKE